MSLKERVLKKEMMFDKEKANKLALWIRDNEEDLKDLLEMNFPISKIHNQAVEDLGDDYPHEVNFKSALFFSLGQLDAIRKMNSSGLKQYETPSIVEDNNDVKIEEVKSEKIKPCKVGNKKYYYAKYILKEKENELIRLSASKKGMQDFLYNKRNKTLDAFGKPVTLKILEIRLASKDDLKKMGIINAGTDK